MVLDRELSNRSNDAFGHQHYADALRDLIETPSNKPPFSIGLLGSWGTGKSSIKELYLNDLRTDHHGNVGGRRSDLIRPIIFNAWKYGNEDLKRALLRYVFMALGGNDEELRRDLYHQVNRTTQTRRSLGDWLKEAVLQNAASVAIFVVLLAVAELIVYFAARLVGLTNQLGLSAVLSSGLIVAGVLAKFVVDLRLKTPSFFNPSTVITFPLTSAEEYERLLVEQIHAFGKTEAGKRCERLVVFVDDLDRLSATEMVNGLDAVRTFLELHLTTGRDNFGVVFVISCDEDRVSEALSRGRRTSDLPGSVFTRADARRYLDRLFQFRLEIPPFPRLDMRNFAEAKLREAKIVASEIEAAGTPLREIIDRLIHVDVQSPRNAIQLVNAFIQSWWIGRRREFDAIGSNAPGGLRKGSVTDHPRALAAVAVLRVDFPDFYQVLQKRPELIQEFTRLLNGDREGSSLALAAEDLLRDFVVEKDGKLTSEVRKEHRSLRRYIVSLQGLRWPKSLQPLLLLSEDPVTRKFGDRATDLFNSFVAGDTRGVLESLGHHLDNDPFSPDDLALIRGLSEDIERESDVRKINAARVLGAIVERIPLDSRRALLTPMAREMAELKDVRMNVGPKAASTILETLADEDQADVAGAFVNDLLSGKQLDWRLPTGEALDLDQMVTTVCDTVAFVLSVRDSLRLSPQADTLVKRWLLTRTVLVGERQTTLSIARLEDWLEGHSGQLVLDLGSDYSAQAIAQLRDRPDELPNVDATIARIGNVHGVLAAGGAESRVDLWTQLTAMVAGQNQAACKAAWTTAIGVSGVAQEGHARAFLVAFAKRLQKEMEDATAWALAWEDGGEKLISLLRTWTDYLDEETADELVGLLSNWAEVDETADFFVSASTILVSKTPTVAVKLDASLMSRPFGDLSLTTYRYEGRVFANIGSTDQVAAATRLTEAISATALTDDMAASYRAFAESVPEETWRVPALQTHISALFDHLLTRTAEPAYIEAILPIARGLFGSAPVGKTGAFLTQLFAPANSSSAAFSTLHKEMTGHWPTEGDSAGTYGANKVAQRALQFVSDHPNSVGSGSVFLSALDLLRSLPGHNVPPALQVSAAVALWPFDSSAIHKEAEAIAPLLGPEDLRAIMNSTSPVGADNADLIPLISLIAKEQPSKVEEVGRAILSDPPREIAGRPDGTVAAYFDALGDGEPLALANLLRDAELNDSQRQRVFQRAIDRREELDSDFFAGILTDLLRVPNHPQTLDLVTSRLADIAALAKKQPKKGALVGALIAALPVLSADNLFRASRAISNLGGSGTLEKAEEILAQLTPEQIAIVAKEFPSSSVLSRMVT